MPHAHKIGANLAYSLPNTPVEKVNCASVERNGKQTRWWQASGSSWGAGLLCWRVPQTRWPVAMDRLWTLAITAGAGAIAAVAGVFLVDRFRSLLKKKPKMKLFNNHLLLSTRCTWLIKGKQYLLLHRHGVERRLLLCRSIYVRRCTLRKPRVVSYATLVNQGVKPLLGRLRRSIANIA